MSNIFSTLSPFRLFVKCAVPNIISMAFISFYYIVDGIFVGKYLGNDALAALALIIPFIMISFALADMIAIGSAVQISMHLGLGKKHLARKIFSSSMLIIFLISCLVGILEYLLSPVLIDFLDVNEDIKSMAKECMLVFALFAPFTMCSFALDNYLRICGKTTYSMTMNVIIALSNIVLDYIFIVVLGWGLFSAALATCLGLMLGGIFGIFPFLFQNLELKFSSLYMNMKIFKNIVYNGSSEFFGNISGSLYGIFANFIIMLIIAMGDAMQPALSYNYAKKDFSRIKDILKVMFFAGAILSLLSVAMIFVLGKDLVGLFTQENDQEFIIFAYMALMLFSFNYLFAWFNVLSGSFLTASNKASFSLILSLSQNLFIPLCFLLILSSIMGLKGVWLSPFFAEFCVLVLACIFVRKVFKKLSFL
ncbi:MATE family efflux transporter [Campylobacter coli]|nr:MATE family efflux transporter [Campylobacter coli]EGT3324064.1 MATE family efflux transporter [Campylobacter coli]EHD3988258.1 MATE family efflux transporter [Campylobacter coli]EHD3992037.1 MATE family efflux transporter [Campylobacter coli]EHF1832893.1 MATE family efflux transporter [Campylobacter coli]